jgi:hypothetical protein
MRVVQWVLSVISRNISSIERGVSPGIEGLPVIVKVLPVTQKVSCVYLFLENIHKYFHPIAWS